MDGWGNVELTMSRASQYAIVLDQKNHTLPFTDVGEEDWYNESVEFVYRQGMMTGTSATTFAPNATLCRAMVAQILYNLEGQPEVTESAEFTDVGEGHWAIDSITWANEAGLMIGYGNDLFYPDCSISREELAQVLYNYAEYRGITLPALGDLSKYPDGGKVQDWAKTAMSWATGLGLINGFEDNTLRPGASTTRAQAATMLMGFAQNLMK